MLAISGNARIFLCQEAVDMRKGFESLSERGRILRFVRFDEWNRTNRSIRSLSVPFTKMGK